MARFKKWEIFQKINETGLVPLFNEPDAEKAKAILRGCYRGGARVVEMTNRGDHIHETFGALTKWAAQELPDLMIGVGTVMDAGTAALYIQLGANFVISPVIHEDVARMCNRRLIGWMPGCATLTEISRAQELGADFVKLFPGETLSPAFVKAALAPMPWTNILVTGGVEPTQESLKAWFDAGAVGVGMGSKLFPKGGRAEDVEEKVRFCIQTIQALKKA